MADRLELEDFLATLINLMVTDSLMRILQQMIIILIDSIGYLIPIIQMNTFLAGYYSEKCLTNYLDSMIHNEFFDYLDSQIKSTLSLFS